MTNSFPKVTPDLRVLSTTPASPAMRWFAFHYTAAADPALPRTVCATCTAGEVTIDGEPMLRFFLVRRLRPPPASLKIPQDCVAGVAGRDDLSAALTHACVDRSSDNSVAQHLRPTARGGLVHR